MSERSPNGLNELSINSPNEPPINVCSCHVHVLNELSVNGLNELSVNGLNELFFKFLPHNVYGLNKIYINLLPLNERDSRRVTSESGIHGMNGLGPESALNVLNDINGLGPKVYQEQVHPIQYYQHKTTLRKK